jgi:hypothetical protein
MLIHKASLTNQWYGETVIKNESEPQTKPTKEDKEKNE